MTNKRNMPSWVQGNDVLLLAWIYEKTLDGQGTPQDVPFDLTACDDITVKCTNGIKRTTLEAAISQDDDKCLAISIPYTLNVGQYLIEVTCRRNGYHVRSFDFHFEIVSTDCEARTTFDVIDGCRSASLRVALQIVPTAEVRGQNSYEMWKQLPGNEDKTLQDYIDEVLDFHARADQINAAERQRVLNETERQSNETDRQEAEAQRQTDTQAAVAAAYAAAHTADEKAALANDKATLADEKATLANDKAALADAAAANANAKAALADEKATLANQKAALADEKATEAGRVNATLSGTTLTVTNREGVSTSVDTKGDTGYCFFALFDVDENGDLWMTHNPLDSVVLSVEDGYLYQTYNVA